jgi:hypothetical protein
MVKTTQSVDNALQVHFKDGIIRPDLRGSGFNALIVNLKLSYKHLPNVRRSGPSLPGRRAMLSPADFRVCNRRVIESCGWVLEAPCTRLLWARQRHCNDGLGKLTPF